MKKRICALFCALLLVTGFSCSVFAAIIVEDETGVLYDTDNPTATTTQPGAISVAAKKAVQSVSGFWHRFGFLTVVILLLVAIVAAIVISEFERQKKEKRPPQPSKNKKKKKK